MSLKASTFQTTDVESQSVPCVVGATPAQRSLARAHRDENRSIRVGVSDSTCDMMKSSQTTNTEGRTIMGDRSDIYIVSESDKATSIGNHVYLHWGGVEALDVALDGLRCVVVGVDRVHAGVVTSSILDILFATQDEVVVTPFAAADIDEYVAQTRNGEHPVLVIDAVRGTVTVRGGSSPHSVGFDELSWSDPDLRGALAKEL